MSIEVTITFRMPAPKPTDEEIAALTEALAPHILREVEALRPTPDGSIH